MEDFLTGEVRRSSLFLFSGCRNVNAVTLLAGLSPVTDLEGNTSFFLVVALLLTVVALLLTVVVLLLTEKKNNEKKSRTRA